MSYSDARRAGSGTNKVYGYATYAANRAPPAGGPGKSRATVTTAVVGPSRRSASATQFGLLDYDAADFTAGGHRSASHADDPGTWKPLRASATTGRKHTAAKDHQLSAAELRERVRREVRAAGGAADSQTDTGAEDDVSSNSDNDDENGGRAGLVHSRASGATGGAHRLSPTRNGNLVATPMSHSDGSRAVTVHDVSRPSEVTVEYTTRVMRRDDMEAHDTSYASRGSGRQSPNRTRQTHNGSLDEIGGGGRGIVQQYASPHDQRATEAHFESRHPVAMTPVPVPVSFDGAQQHQFDRIERGMDAVVTSADGAAASVAKLQEDMRHRDAVRRAAEEERDVANASAIERVVEHAIASLADRTAEAGQVRLHSVRTALETADARLTGIIEAEARRVMSANKQSLDELRRAVAEAAERSDKAVPQASASLAQILVGDAASAPTCLEARLKAALHQNHTSTVASVQADLRHEVAEAVRAIATDRTDADNISEASAQRRGEDLEQRLRSALLLDASHGREQQTSTILDTFDKSFGASKQAASEASSSLSNAVRSTAEATQDLVSRESARVRADVAGALNDLNRVAQDSVESRGHFVAMTQQAIEEQQRRVVAATEAALERHQRETTAAVETLSARVGDRVAAAVLEQSPQRTSNTLTGIVQGPVDGAVQNITAALERTERRREAAAEALPALLAREVTSLLPAVTAAAVRPIVESEVQSVGKVVRDTLEAHAAQSTTRLERALEQQQKASSAATERAAESAAKQASAAVTRDTHTALESLRAELMRGFTTALSSAQDDAHRYTTSACETSASKTASTIESTVERLARTLSEKQHSSSADIAHKAAAEAVQSARSDTVSAIESTITRSMEGRIGTAITESLTKTRETVREATEASRRERDANSRRDTDEILAAVRLVDAAVHRISDRARLDEEAARDNQASVERQRRMADVAALRTAGAVSRTREAFDGTDDEQARLLEQLTAEVQRYRDGQRDRFASVIKTVREQEAANAEATKATGVEIAAHAADLSEITASLRSLRGEREAAMEELQRIRSETEHAGQRCERFSAEAMAAEERRDQALMAAATAEKELGELQLRVSDLKEKEGTVKTELARIQTQVSSVAALREVMLRDVQRLNGTGLTAASTRGPGSVGRSVGSAAAASPAGGIRRTEPHES